MPIIGHTRKAGGRAPQHIRGLRWASPFADGLIGCWPLLGNLALPNLAIDIANGKNSTDTNASRARSAVGDQLQSAVVDINADEYQCGAHALHEVTNHTVSMWLTFEVASPGAVQVMFGKSNSILAGGFEWGRFNADLRFAYYDSGVKGWYTRAFTPVLDKPYHLVMRRNGTAISWFVDGVKLTDQTAATTGQTYNGDTLDIGHGHTVSNLKWPGVIADVKFYDRAHSDEFCRALYQPSARWDVYDQGARTYFIPAAAGGPTTHTITPSGGVAFAGSGVYQYARTHDVSGGVQLAGSAALKATRIHDVSGGVQFSGTSTFNVSRDIVPDGGVQLGGSATQTNVRVHDVSGGLSFSGAAGMQATRVLSPSGGLSLGGTGNFTGVEAGLTIVPSGGIQFGGGASGTLWPDNLAYGGFAHRVARKVADDVTDDVTDFHRRYDD